MHVPPSPPRLHQDALVRAEKRAITCNDDIPHYLRKLPEPSELTLNDFSLDPISRNNLAISALANIL
jgi:hypothetical protein